MTALLCLKSQQVLSIVRSVAICSEIFYEGVDSAGLISDMYLDINGSDLWFSFLSAPQGAVRPKSENQLVTPLIYERKPPIRAANCNTQKQYFF